MNKILSILLLPVLTYAPCGYAHESDDPLLTKFLLEQFEWRSTSTSDDADQTTVAEGEAWLGKDLNKLWLKFDVQRQAGDTSEAEVQALYSRAIAPFWDLQLGLRQDLKPSPQQTWGVLGIKGLAPYYFDLDAALFLGESGAAALRINLEYELLFSQKLILSPELKMNFYGQNQAEYGQGAGLADTDFGLRLRYEITREFAPYLGYSWARKFGTSADYARLTQEPTSENQWVIGIRAWY